AALDRIFACLVAGGAGAFLNALKHHVVRKHGTGGLRGVFQGRLNTSGTEESRPTRAMSARNAGGSGSMSASKEWTLASLQDRGCARLCGAPLSHRHHDTPV
ncbi:hypothetical protein, partial [Xanthomonas phaseoli]|uniref:hypothetical protein n=1 Tax=Xanthomonas phaseoli TaxID=1985254 RepID=UPI00193A7110